MDDAAQPLPFPIGATVGGKYTLDRLIGSGGMGAVYEATNAWTGRRVAIKVLLAEHSRRSDAVERFAREARAATQIAHPNIVDILDMGQDAETGALFIVQEFLDGMDLSQWLRQHGPVAAGEALAMLAPAMSALVAAHDRGVIHRDLKPENLFLVRTQGGGVITKLIDFGISKFVDTTGNARGRTATGMAIGTPQYMSPEQARGDRDVDARSDVWSMAVVLYELLSGRTPFDAPNYNLLIVQVITQAPTRIETLVPAVDPILADVLHRALAPDRDQRFQSMQQFLAALLDVVGADVASVADPRWPSGDAQLAQSAPLRLAASDRPSRPSLEVTARDGASSPTVTRTPAPWSGFPGSTPAPTRRGVPAWVFGLVGGLVFAALVVGTRDGSRLRRPSPNLATRVPVTFVAVRSEASAASTTPTGADRLDGGASTPSPPREVAVPPAGLTAPLEAPTAAPSVRSRPVPRPRPTTTRPPLFPPMHVSPAGAMPRARPRAPIVSVE